MTSKEILRALEKKHSKDIFVPECKNGCSCGGHLRMDAWVMKPSWVNPLVIVYEIKVSRGDFLNDGKYQNYLPYCNEFYFVCPPKLIQPNEIPDDCGLMWISSTGTRIYTKKKAKYREVKIPLDLYRYILMCRVDICKWYNDYRPANKKVDDLEFWTDWLNAKTQSLDLGYRVSKKLRGIIDERINRAERTNGNLLERMKSYEDIRKFLEKLEIDPDGNIWQISKYKVEQKIAKFNNIISEDIQRRIKRTIDELTNLQTTIEEEKKVINESAK